MILLFTFQAGEKKWGTDESRFNVVLATRNFHQLRATFDEYVKVGIMDYLSSTTLSETSTNLVEMLMSFL